MKAGAPPNKPGRAGGGTEEQVCTICDLDSVKRIKPSAVRPVALPESQYCRPCTGSGRCVIAVWAVVGESGAIAGTWSDERNFTVCRNGVDWRSVASDPSGSCGSPI